MVLCQSTFSNERLTFCKEASCTYNWNKIWKLTFLYFSWAQGLITLCKVLTLKVCPSDIPVITISPIVIIRFYHIFFSIIIFHNNSCHVNDSFCSAFLPPKWTLHKIKAMCQMTRRCPHIFFILLYAKWRCNTLAIELRQSSYHLHLHMEHDAVVPVIQVNNKWNSINLSCEFDMMLYCEISTDLYREVILRHAGKLV